MELMENLSNDLSSWVLLGSYELLLEFLEDI